MTINQFTQIKHALRSVVAIPVTPFRADGRVDFEAYQNLVTRLIEGGVDVLTPNGNTGEFYALSPDECRGAVEATIAGAAGRALIVAGVGFDVATAVEMGRFAQEVGAQAVMIHQMIHPYQSAAGWVEYHQAIAESLPEMGIVPYVRDAFVTGAMLRQLADRCPNLVGVKYAVPNPMLFTSIVQAVGAERLTWVCGLAEGWAPFFWVGGAQGFTSGLVNVQPTLSLRMLHALRAGNYTGAMAVWSLIRPFEELRARGNNANNVSAVKEALAQLGLCGATVRPPITELSEAERAEVRVVLGKWRDEDAEYIRSNEQ